MLGEHNKVEVIKRYVQRLRIKVERIKSFVAHINLFLFPLRKSYELLIGFYLSIKQCFKGKEIQGSYLYDTYILLFIITSKDIIAIGLFAK